MVIKVMIGWGDGVSETNTLRSIEDLQLSASGLAEWCSVE
jgi:hypothetical protein